MHLADLLLALGAEVLLALAEAEEVADALLSGDRILEGQDHHVGDRREAAFIVALDCDYRAPIADADTRGQMRHRELARQLVTGAGQYKLAVVIEGRIDHDPHRWYPVAEERSGFIAFEGIELAAIARRTQIDPFAGHLLGFEAKARRLKKLGPSQVGTAQIRSDPVDPAEVGPGQVRMDEAGVRENRIAQIGPGEGRAA